MKIDTNIKKEYFEKYLTNEITTKDLSLIFNCTQRAIQYQIARYKELGDKALSNGNIGKSRMKKGYAEKASQLWNMFSKKNEDGDCMYDGISYTYFQELAQEQGINCSVTFVKKVLNKNGYFTPIAHTVGSKKDKHEYRERKESSGMLVQGDGCSYDWLGDGKKYCLQGWIDDATGIPVGLYMTRNECLLGYIEATRTMAHDYGIPQAMYPDQSRIFFYGKMNDAEAHEKHKTQFAKMMEKLGTEIIPAHSPQAKGRIERLWGTLKQRLGFQLRFHNIKTMEEANKFIHDKFLPKFIKRFAKKPRNEQTAFIKADMQEINSCLRAIFKGKTDNAGCFFLKGYKFYVPGLRQKKINICLSIKDGMWVECVGNKDKRYKVILCEGDSSGTLPEVYKDLIDTVFLQNAKSSFREYYYALDTEIKRIG